MFFLLSRVNHKLHIWQQHIAPRVEHIHLPWWHCSQIIHSYMTCVFAQYQIQTPPLIAMCHMHCVWSWGGSNSPHACSRRLHVAILLHPSWLHVFHFILYLQRSPWLWALLQHLSKLQVIHALLCQYNDISVHVTYVLLCQHTASWFGRFLQNCAFPLMHTLAKFFFLYFISCATIPAIHSHLA